MGDFSVNDTTQVILQEDIEDTNSIIYITFFVDVDSEDVCKVNWLLGKYTDMIDVIKNYEFALGQIEEGLVSY